MPALPGAPFLSVLADAVVGQVQTRQGAMRRRGLGKSRVCVCVFVCVLCVCTVCVYVCERDCGGSIVS